jgi:hypothetical protein
MAKFGGFSGVLGNALDPLNISGARTGDNAQNYGNQMNAAISQVKPAFDTARATTTAGYDAARKKFQTNEIVGSRQELYQRMLGKGGYSDETKNAMKGSSIEQAGTQMRDVQNSLQDRYGDASGGGMTGENLARAMASVGANKANAIRNVDTESAKLAEQQQTDSINSLYQDASTQAGLDTGEAGTLAGLTTEEAKALAEMLSAKATGMSTIMSKPNGLGSILGGG